jgi:hypothetical protein
MGSKCGSTEEDIREPRGISKEVWDARPYVKWCPDDPTPILEAYEGLADSQVNFMRSLAIQKPGWIINRHAVPGAPHVWPEIRPDGLVRTGPPTLHWHGTGEVPEFPNKGCRILPHGSVAWADHCRRVNDNDLEADTKHETREDPHRHENLAKYCFPPAALEDVEWWHDHIFYYDKPEEKLKAHREKWHKEEPPNKREDGKHLHMRRTKSAESLARRLDVHPMAKPLFAPSRVVYFVIEGCLNVWCEF